MLFFSRWLSIVVSISFSFAAAAGDVIQQVMEAQWRHFNSIEALEVSSTHQHSRTSVAPNGAAELGYFTVQTHRFRMEGEKWRHDITATNVLNDHTKDYRYSFDGDLYYRLIVKDAHVLRGSEPEVVFGDPGPSPPPHLIPYRFASSRPNIDAYKLLSQQSFWEDLEASCTFLEDSVIDRNSVCVLEISPPKDRDFLHQERKFEVSFAIEYDYLPLRIVEYWPDELGDWFLKNVYSFDDIVQVKTTAGTLFFSKHIVGLPYEDGVPMQGVAMASEITTIDPNPAFQGAVFSVSDEHLRFITELDLRTTIPFADMAENLPSLEGSRPSDGVVANYGSVAVDLPAAPAPSFNSAQSVPKGFSLRCREIYIGAVMLCVAAIAATAILKWRRRVHDRLA